MLPVPSWHNSSMSVFYLSLIFLFLSLNSVRIFRKNSNVPCRKKTWNVFATTVFAVVLFITQQRPGCGDIFTVHVDSMKEGNVFSRFFLSVYRRSLSHMVHQDWQEGDPPPPPSFRAKEYDGKALPTHAWLGRTPTLIKVGSVGFINLSGHTSCRYISLCKPAIWGLLGAPEAVPFLTSKYILIYLFIFSLRYVQ